MACPIPKAAPGCQRYGVVLEAYDFAADVSHFLSLGNSHPYPFSNKPLLSHKRRRPP
jgi:hypothetical protein